MATKRRRFTAEFKKRVALDALRGDHTIQAVAAKHQVHPSQVSTWKRHARGEGDCPLLRSLTGRRVTPAAVRAMLKRRLASAGLPDNLTPHSFRVMVVTALLSQNVPVEEVQHLVGHSHPSTTQLYDRRRRRVTRSIVERIPF